MGIVGREYRVNTGQVCQRDDAARGVAIEDQSARRSQTGRLCSIIKSMPAPRGSGIVAADERQALTSLRNEMPRDSNAGLVIVESSNSIDGRQRKLPGLHDRNARALQQARTVVRRR